MLGQEKTAILLMQNEDFRQRITAQRQGKRSSYFLTVPNIPKREEKFKMQEKIGEDKTISSAVIRRLPRYHRFLGELEMQGVEKVSSRELSERMGSTASQIRQDFNCFGGFGQQGYGYTVSELHEKIGGILGVNSENRTVVIGAGNLGKAIAAHVDFSKKGCKLVGIFDVSPELVNMKIEDINGRKFEILSDEKLNSFCKKEKPGVAVLCIPQSEAKDVVKRLIGLGIKAFWNFSHYDVKHDYPDVIVENVHLGDSLMTLAYGLNHINSINN